MAKTMNTYLCEFSLPDMPDGERFYYRFQAEDDAHAKDQLLDAEPKAFCIVTQLADKTREAYDAGYDI